MGTARTRANNKWNAKAYDRVNLTIPKGTKEAIKEHAVKYDGGSVNAFINRAIAEAMARDSENSFILTDPSESSYNAGK